MVAVVQRVARAKVTSSAGTLGEIGPGLAVLVGVSEDDGPEDAAWLADKCAGLRIFQDDLGKMNESVLDSGGAALVVSQFTLIADCRKGRRPSFKGAAEPDKGERLYELFADGLREAGVTVATGEFGASMLVSIDNDGPVTIILDSADRRRPRRRGDARCPAA